MPYQAQAVDDTEPISDTSWELTANAALYNVISGCDVTLDAGNMTVDVAAGTVTHNGAVVSVSSQVNVVTLTADGTNPRWAWIGINSGGTAVLVSGTAAADPSVPELGDNVALSLIRIPAAETIAANCTDIEKRIPSVSPLTTEGDILYRSASGLARLAKGTSGHYLQIGASIPAWAAVASDPWTHIVKSATETVNNSTVLQNDDHFTFTTAANTD